MKPEIIEVLGRKVPLAIIGVLLLQGATAVWWASAKNRDNYFLEQRVTKLEGGFASGAESQHIILERLARIEERTHAQSAVLDRIEKRVSEINGK